MAEQIENLMGLADCDRERAIECLEIAKYDMLEALYLALKSTPTICPPPQKTMNEEQQFFKEVRHQMDNLVEGVRKGFISSNQSEPLEHSETQIPHVEMAQQSNYSQECLPPSPELKAQIPGIAYQSQSEYFCDLQSSVQKLLCSDQESPQ